MKDYKVSFVSRFRKRRNVPVLVAITVILLFVGWLSYSFIIRDILDNRDSAKQAEVQNLAEDVESEILKASAPMGTYRFKEARTNLDLLKRNNPSVEQRQTFLIRYFLVCVELADETCAKKTARQIVALESSGKPYKPNQPQSLVDLIVRYSTL